MGLFSNSGNRKESDIRIEDMNKPQARSSTTLFLSYSIPFFHT